MISQFNALCAFRQKTPGIPGSRLGVNDPILSPVIKSLLELQHEFFKKFGKYKGFNFKVEVSKGQSNFPSIFHLCILPPGQKVSDGIYVAMCFDKYGKGAVVGCLKSVSNPKRLITVVRKSRTLKPKLDVDGLRPTTKYNNVFENPMEFYSKLESPEGLINHVEKSLDRALYNLGLIDPDSMSIKEKSEAGLNSLEFDPENLETAKTVIARQIVARLGQAQFRNELLSAYDSKCAVTGCKTIRVLEAAHILPYAGKQTNHVQNGLLLRSDIHLLFDLGLLTIDSVHYKVKIHKELEGSEYFAFHNKGIHLPEKISQRPSTKALRIHNSTFSK